METARCTKPVGAMCCGIPAYKRDHRRIWGWRPMTKTPKLGGVPAYKPDHRRVSVTAQMMPQGTLLLRNQATKEITQYNHEPESIPEDS